MTAGYVNFTSPMLGSTHYVFHWIVEAVNGAANAPIVFWTNGGPGCSGLFGMGWEHGPFIIEADGKTLSPNPYSWNQFATVVYIEQPAGVGFSFSSVPGDYNRYNDDISQTDNYAFMKAFFAQYPQYASRPLWLTSESYGGNYIPQLSRQILTGSDTRLASQLKAGGIAVGNPVFSSDTASFDQIMSLVQANILYAHAALPQAFYDEYTGTGCASLNPPAECGALTDTMFSLAGACFETNACGDDLYADVTGNATLGPMTVPGYNRDETWGAYLAREDVMAAIHALPPPYTPWSDCADIGYDITWPSNLPDYEALFSAGVKTLVFSGDVDIATCPFASTQFAVQALNRTAKTTWAAWTVDTAAGAGQLGGYIQDYDGYTFATVKAGGHEATGYMPLSSYALIEGFITGKGVKRAGQTQTRNVAGKRKRNQAAVLRDAIARSRKAREEAAQ